MKYDPQSEELVGLTILTLDELEEREIALPKPLML